MSIENLEKKIENKEIKVSVIGLGRIGLPTAVEFASHGYYVIGVDINQKLLEDLRNSRTFVDEPGLQEILKNSNENKRIEFTDDLNYAVNSTDLIVLCLPTPINQDFAPDYSIIESVAQKIGKNLKKGQICIVESSVSPTTTEKLIAPILASESKLIFNKDFYVCSCPERADPGKIVANFDVVPRIVGGSTPEITKLVSKIYQTITNAKILEVSNPGTANAIKLTENIFRDVNIALINELAVLYEMLNIDIKEVIMGCSTKYNFQPHYPGPGVGGPCLPANPYYIIKDAAKVNYIPFLIRVAREVNDRMPEHVVELIIRSLNEIGKALKDTPITILGISYKANVRDIQISPAVKVIHLLQKYGANLKIFDPYYKGEKVENFQVEESLEKAVDNTSAIAVLTEHKEFINMDFSKFKFNDHPLVLIDSRNIFSTKKLPKGTIYCGVGRPLQYV